MIENNEKIVDIFVVNRCEWVFAFPRYEGKSPGSLSMELIDMGRLGGLSRTKSLSGFVFWEEK